MTNWDQGYCPTCGAGLVPDATFCGNCGTSFAGHHDSGYQNPGYRDSAPTDAGYPEDTYYEPGHPDPGHRTAAYPGGGYETAGYGTDGYGAIGYGPDGYQDAVPQENVYRDDTYGDAPATEDGEGSDRKSTLLLLLTGVLILGVTVASSNLLSGGDDDDDGQSDLGDAVPAAGLTDGQVLLQDAGDVPEGAFLDAPELDLARGGEPDVPMDEVLRHVVTLPELATARDATTASLAALTVSGTDPGTYAGHRGQGVCDRSVLADAVAASGDGQDEADTDDSEGGDGDDTSAPTLLTSGDVYADLLGLDDPGEVGDLLDDLTPVRLRFDTRVTQLTLTGDSEPAPVQTILQAGTAVLVDDTGLPRVSCNGANPLAAPDPVADDLNEETALDTAAWAANVDQSWERFDPSRVVTITPGTGEGEHDEFLFADIATTDLIERPVGSNGSRDLGPGDIVVTLSWDSPADLDLAVIDPNEALISANIPEPENSRGRLSEDANVRCEENMTGEERVTWPDGDAPQGDYTIRVTGHAVGEGPSDDDEMLYEADCGGESAEFRLTVRLYQQDTVVHEGSVQDSVTEEFTVTLGTAPAGTDPDDGDSGSGDSDGADGDSGDDGSGDNESA